MLLKEVCDKIMVARDITASTRKSICDNLKMYSKDLKETDIIKMLEDYEKLDSYLQNKKSNRGKNIGQNLAPNSLKTYYTTLVTASKALKIKDDAMQFYTKRMEQYAKQSDEQRDEAIVPEKFEDGKLPPWSDIEDLQSKFVDKEKYSIDHAIVALYTTQPPRRLEYRTLYLLDQKPEAEPTVKPRYDDGDVDSKGIPFNYIYPKGDLYDVVLRDYKTNRRKGFGVFKNTLSKLLSEILKGYIEKAKIKPNTPLFPTKQGKNKNKPMADTNFGKRLVTALGIHYKKVELSEQNIRDMYVDSVVKRNPDMSVKKKKEIAYLMGHTFQTQQEAYGKNQSPQQTPQDEPQDEQPEITTESIEPEPIPIQEEAESSPSVEILEQVEKLDKVDKESVLRSMKQYYDLKAEYMRKKIAMLDKML